MFLAGPASFQRALQATCSQDGIVRIYEAPDIMNLAQWTFQHEISTAKLRCSCVAWNPSRYLAATAEQPLSLF